MLPVCGWALRAGLHSVCELHEDASKGRESCRIALWALFTLPAPGCTTQELVLNRGVRLQDYELVESALDTLERKSPSRLSR